eukprot:393034-Prymnesium_polylepis.1
MLARTPGYAGKRDLRVYMPCSLLEKKLALETQVVLYASPNNPGAEEAAEEMCSSFAALRVTSRRPCPQSRRASRSSPATSIVWPRSQSTEEGLEGRFDEEM